VACYRAQPNEAESQLPIGRAGVEIEGSEAMTASNSNAAVERMTEVIFDALKNGKHPHSSVNSVPGGLTDIDGSFDLSIVAQACITEIETLFRRRLAELELKVKGSAP
jgi:hypothetical protein